MKKYTLLFTFLLVILFVAACGAPATTATETEALSQPTATAAIPQTGSGSGDNTQVVITLADNTIEASQTSFQVGVPYTFVINNQGRRAHNFNINTPVAEAGSLDAALASALLVVSRDELPAGGSATVQYTFPESAAGQNLEFSCLIKRHYEDEMLLPISVTN